MGLLDLPPELFQAVVDAMVAAGTSRKTTNLRLVNKLFNHAVADALLRSGYINPKRYGWSKRICPEFLLKFLMWKMELDKTTQHPLRLIINSSIDLFAKTQLAIRGTKDHRPTLNEEYTYILLQSTVEHVCAKDVLASLEPVQKDISPAEIVCGALAIAASLGDLMIVKSLMDDGANIKQQSEYFSSPLRCAARCDKLDVVRWLLDCGADITNPIPWKKHDSTALDSACYAGHKEIVQLLLEPSYSLEKSGPNYERAACSALRKSHLGLVRYLIDEYTADVAYLKQTLFLEAVALGYLAVASMMLDEGADIDGKTRLVHVSALELAAKGGHTSVVQFLLDRGHDRRPSKCSSALITAARFGRKDIVWLLLKNGVDVNATTSHPCGLPFHGTAIEAAVDNDDEDMVRFLLNHGVDLNARRQGYKALQTACRKGYVALVRFFIDVCGLDPNGSDLDKSKRFPPMLTALCHNWTDVVKELLRLGADEVDPLTSVMSGHFRYGRHLRSGQSLGHI